MMQVLLDDKPCDVGATTVGEAIEAAAALVEPRGRIIVEVSVDGTPWSESRLAGPELNDGAGVVRLASADPQELVGRTFADAADALDDADELQQKAARLLQSDQRAVALDDLAQAVSIWIQVQQVIVKGARLAGLDLDRVELPRPIGDAIGSLNQRLEAIRAALAGGDEIGLADTLLYEFPDVVEEWRSILAALQHQVESTRR